MNNFTFYDISRFLHFIVKKYRLYFQMNFNTDILKNDKNILNKNLLLFIIIFFIFYIPVCV